MRVIVVPLTAYGDAATYNSFVNAIVGATNRQNAIKPADLIANDQKQVLVERILRNRKYLYQRKRRSNAEEKELFGTGYIKISKEYLAQIQATLMYGPSGAKSVDQIFETGTYEHLFNATEAEYYLLRYWLMQLVKRNKNNTEMSRANWLVLSLVWDKLGRHLISKNNSNVFISICE